MSALSKLNQARQKFHAMKIEKTGNNKFAGYKYFELGDFLIPALSIFNELNLSAVVSFGVDLATLTITDLEDEGSQFVITSPMSTAALKACHEVQNLGAVQTYLRRYLWVAALEIVEHDALDATTGKEEPAKKQQPERTRVMKITNAIKGHLADGRELGALQEWEEACDVNEEFAGHVWAGLSTPERATLRDLKKQSQPA